MSYSTIASTVSSASSAWLAAAKKSLNQHKSNVVSTLPTASNSPLGMDLLKSIYDSKAVTRKTLESYWERTNPTVTDTAANYTADSTTKKINAALGTILDSKA